MDQQDKINFIQTLPDELLTFISSEIEVGSLLDFSLTCRRFYQLSADRLERNQRYHKDYRVTHDRLPLTIPNLLREVLADSDIVWHVRVLETWGVRPYFSQWKTWDFWFSNTTEDRNIWPDPVEDHSSLNDDYFTKEDYGDFTSLMRDVLHLDTSCAKWMDAIHKGGDEALKGLLIALLPKLKKINLLPYNTDDFKETAVHSLGFLDEAIISFLGKPLSRWPPGFRSLREVSVCTNSPHQHPHDAWYPTQYSVSWLFYLPSLKILNLSLIGIGGNDEEGDFAIDARSSSVEELSFYVCEMASEEDWGTFIQAPKRLKKFTAESCVSNQPKTCDALWRALEVYQGQWLEEIHVESSPYQSSLVNMQSNFPNLKICDNLEDYTLLKNSDSPKDLVFRPECSTSIHSSKTRKNKKEIYQIVDLTKILPTSLEILWLAAPTMRYHKKESLLPTAAIRDEVLRAIADVVEDERFSSLKEICLSQLLLLNTEDTPVWDQEVLRRITDKGIETHMYNPDGTLIDSDHHWDLHHEDRYKRGIIESDPFPAGHAQVDVDESQSENEDLEN